MSNVIPALTNFFLISIRSQFKNHLNKSASFKNVYLIQAVFIQSMQYLHYEPFFMQNQISFL